MSVKSFFVGLAGDLGLDFLVHSWLTKHGADAFQHVVEKVTDDVRVEVLSYIQSLPDEEARKNWWRRYKKTNRSGEPIDTENRFMNLASRIYLALKDDPDELEGMFILLGRMSDNDFEESLKAVENDSVKVFFKKVGEAFKKFAQPITDSLNSLSTNLKKRNNSNRRRKGYKYQRSRKPASGLFGSILETIREIGREIIYDAAELSHLTTWVSRHDRSALEVYLRNLAVIAGFIILFPFVPLIIRTLGGPGWIVSFAGLFLALCTFWLALIATPLAIVLGAIQHGIKGTVSLIKDGPGDLGKRYVHFVLWFFLIETFAFLSLSIIPIYNNPKLVPIILLAVLVIVTVNLILGVGNWFKKFARFSSVAVVIILILSLVFPQTTNSLLKIEVDKGIAETVDTMRNSSITSTAQAAPIPKIKKVVAKANQWSDKVTNDDVPANWERWIYSSEKTLIRFSDGTIGPALGSYGVRPGAVDFMCPTGEDTVTVLFLQKGIAPPSEAPK
ncbi:MAG: hypothetical protein WCX12_03350 [Candidatus Paceibacterota bacterium]|jgi:hypothetical protein